MIHIHSGQLWVVTGPLWGYNDGDGWMGHKFTVDKLVNPEAHIWRVIFLTRPCHPPIWDKIKMDNIHYIAAIDFTKHCRILEG